MTIDLKRIVESKKAFRRNLAQKPVSEKLAMLDTLRERTLTIRKAAGQTSSTHESSARYRTEKKNNE